MLPFQNLPRHVPESPVKIPPLQVPLTKPRHREICSTSRAFFYISFFHIHIPSKGAPLPGSPCRAPTERDALFPEPSFTYLSKSLVKESLLQVPPVGPLWRGGASQSLLLHISRSPNEKGLLIK
jgi:hypothetical protein